MSSYLLLRNNKESGPFNMDEVKSLSLKPYDLIWVVGKSAAWRYPGEIPELKTFAPPVPEQDSDYFRKRTISESKAADAHNMIVPDSFTSQSSSVGDQQPLNKRPVYVNLTTEKKSGNELSEMSAEDSGLVVSDSLGSAYDFSEIYTRQPSPAARYSGRILWVSTIVLLFGAGIMTGFFISDRRKFFTSDENHPQINPTLQQVVFKEKKENSNGAIGNNGEIKTGEITILNPDSIRKTVFTSRKQNSAPVKKIIKTIEVNKDSIAAEQALLSAMRISDSLKKDAINKSEMLYQKIKANPEKYLNLVTGRYSTGLFGGISSFPVTITNNSSVKIEMVDVTINYIQNNEKVFKTEILSFNDLQPGETLTLKAPKSSRGTKITTQMHIVKVHQPDAASSN